MTLNSPGAVPATPITRRSLLSKTLAYGCVPGLATGLSTGVSAVSAPAVRTRFAVSTYSFWQFNRDELRDIFLCLDLAAEWGFDGVEILHRQMTDESNSTLQKIKQRAFVNGLDLCGFSTHQGWVSPDADVRRQNTEHTIRCIELSYALGIPTHENSQSHQFAMARDDPGHGQLSGRPIRATGADGG